jgi:ribosomal protein S19E (S16A)
MTGAIRKVKWTAISGKVFKWWHKRGDTLLIKISTKRDQSIEILQKRYGYSKEQAASEFKKHYSTARLN